MDKTKIIFSDATILRPVDAARLLGLSRPTLYRYVAEGRLVRPTKIGKRAVGWQFSTLRAFIESRG